MGLSEVSAQATTPSAASLPETGDAPRAYTTPPRPVSRISDSEAVPVTLARTNGILRLDQPTVVIDHLPHRYRRREDLIDTLGTLIGIALLWVFGVFAQSTTQGVTSDVRSAVTSMIHTVLLIPLTFVETLVLLVAPVMLIVTVALRRHVRTTVWTLGVTVAAGVVGWLMVWGITVLPPAWATPLLVQSDGRITAVINVAMLVVAAVATICGEMSSTSVVRWTWWALWVIALLAVVKGSITLVGVLISILMGRLVGCLARYFTGFEDRRASTSELVLGLLAIGILPRRVVRLDGQEPLKAWEITHDFSAGVTRLGMPRTLATSELTAKPELTALEEKLRPRPSHASLRAYVVQDHAGDLFDLTVWDPGREITGTISQVWENLRLRGIGRWVSTSLKANAERCELTALAAMRAGAQVPEPVGLVPMADSVLTVTRALPDAQPLVQAGERVSDQVLDQAWQQLAAAHLRGVAHRQLDADAVVLDDSDTVWLVGWERGDVATSQLTRRIDNAQLLALLATVVGVKRAVASARRNLSERYVEAIGPALQNAVLPLKTTQTLKHTKTLEQLREALRPNASQATQPLKLQRFQLRTVVLVIIFVAALIAVAGSMNFEQIMAAVRSANPWWLAVAVVFSASTWVGGGMPLAYMTTEKIRLRDSVIVQTGASVVSIIAPAGIGPAALQLRFLMRQGVTAPIAVATITLLQVSQFVITVVMLLMVLATGQSVSVQLPYSTIVAVSAVVLIVVAVGLSIPQLRRWIWSKVEPTWHHVAPRLAWIVGQPQALIALLGGNALLNVGFIGAFWACLEAFGIHLNLLTLSVTYLAANTLGSVVPSPGGIGPVEAALTGGLVVVGVPQAAALSVAVLFRVVTFYGRVLPGWVALQYLQKKQII